MSKAFGAVGGVVAGNPVVWNGCANAAAVPVLISHDRPNAAACLAALDLLEESTELVDGCGRTPLFQSRNEALGLRHR